MPLLRKKINVLGLLPYLQSGLILLSLMFLVLDLVVVM